MAEVVSCSIIEGWAGKSDTLEPYLRDNYWVVPDVLWATKGKKSTWHESDWPPVKVRITVEVLE
jgi:hypothetical protein